MHSRGRKIKSPQTPQSPQSRHGSKLVQFLESSPEGAKPETSKAQSQERG